MKFVFLGDVHGNLDICKKVSRENPSSFVIQIGDLGVGFLPRKQFLKLPTTFKFFVGNHDNRQEAKTLPHCLGDFGVAFDKFFFVSGANSIDVDMRIPGLDWWADEELTYKEAENCLSMWENSTVDVLVSHDCPQSIAKVVHGVNDKSLTRNLLQSMIESRKPEMIIYGHHHKSKRGRIEGMGYVGLDINEPFPVAI